MSDNKSTDPTNGGQGPYREAPVEPERFTYRLTLDQINRLLADLGKPPLTSVEVEKKRGEEQNRRQAQLDREAEEMAKAAAAAKPKRLTTAKDVINAMLKLGATPGLSTGFPTLDSCTRGGLRPGVLGVGGGPAALKTAFSVQLSKRFYEAGHPVMVYACDEPNTKVLMRCGQQLGHDRGDIEMLDRVVLRQIESHYDSERFGLVDADDEDALGLDECVQHLEEMRTKHGKTPLLVVDSLQGLADEVESDPKDGERERLMLATKRLKKIGKTMLVIVTSEVTKEHLKPPKKDDPRHNPMTAFFGSNKIAHAIDIGLVFTRDGDEAVNVEFAKSRVGERRDFRLAFDMKTTILTETAVQAPAQSSTSRSSSSGTMADVLADMTALRDVLRVNPGVSGNVWYAAAKTVGWKGNKTKFGEIVHELFVAGELENDNTSSRSQGKAKWRLVDPQTSSSWVMDHEDNDSDQTDGDYGSQ